MKEITFGPATPFVFTPNTILNEGDLVYFQEGDVIPIEAIILDMDYRSGFHYKAHDGYYRSSACISNNIISGTFNNDKEFSGVMQFEKRFPDRRFLFNGTVSLNGASPMVLDFTHVVQCGDMVVTGWMLCLVFATGKNMISFLGECPSPLSNEQIRELPMSGVRLALLDSDLFDGEVGCIGEIEIGGSTLMLGEMLHPKHQFSPLLKNFGSEIMRFLLVVLCGMFPTSTLTYTRNCLKLHGIHLCFLAAHYNELDTLLVPPLIIEMVENTFTLKGCSNGEMHTYTIERGVGMYQAIIHESINNMPSKSYLFTISNTGLLQNIFWTDKIEDDIDINQEPNALFILKVSSNIDIKLHKSIKYIVIGRGAMQSRMIHAIQASFCKRTVIATDSDFNIFGVVDEFNYGLNGSQFNELGFRKWYFTDNSVLVLSGSQLNICEGLENVLEYVTHKKFLGKNSVIGISSNSEFSVLDYFHKKYPTYSFATGMVKGISNVLHNLEQLQYLCPPSYHATKVMNASNLGISKISSTMMSQLTSGDFKELNLDNNQLEFIHPSIGSIPGLSKVTISGNPFYSVPESYRHDWKKMKEYMSMIKSQSSHWNTCRLLVLGQEAVGKVREYEI